MLYNSHIRVALVPRFTGHAEPPARGHAAKKDIPMLIRLTKGVYLILSKGWEFFKKRYGYA